MPIDPYAPCPCGSGKKIKFCCPDLVGEMEKIARMLEGEQYVACLSHVERLVAKQQDRASLLGLQAMLQTALGKYDDAQATLDHFLTKHPNNSIGLAEQAVLKVERGTAREAALILQKALQNVAGDGIPQRVYVAIGTVANGLFFEGEFFAARAHWMLQAGMAGSDDSRPVATLIKFYATPSVSVLLKEEYAWATAPDDAPYKSLFDNAMRLVAEARWHQASEQLASLANQYPTAPPLWRNLGLALASVADSGDVAALHKYAALDVPLEDAVELEALAQSIDTERVGDQLDVARVTYPVVDVEGLVAALQGNPRLDPLPVDGAPDSPEEGPPPQAVFVFYDRPVPKTGVDMPLEAVPEMIGWLYLFGRETDREPRLELSATVGDHLEAAQQSLRDIAGSLVGEPSEAEVLGPVSRRAELFTWKCRMPDDTPRERASELLDQHRHEAIFQRWADLPQAALGGKSVRDVAREPEGCVPALAAVLIVEMSALVERYPIDFNELRRQLGLPTADPIDPTGLDAEDLPMSRVGRVIADRLSDEQLLRLYRQAMLVGARRPLGCLAAEVVRRDSLEGEAGRAEAYRVLAEQERDPEKAIEYLQQGAAVAEAAGNSSAEYDLAQLNIRMSQGQVDGAQKLLKHIIREHGQEPGVGEELRELLASFGIAPRGGERAAAPAEEPPQVLVPGSSPIWTPGGESGDGGEKKIWTPGQD